MKKENMFYKKKIILNYTVFPAIAGCPIIVLYVLCGEYHVLKRRVYGR